jgi:hypothetical protein
MMQLLDPWLVERPYLTPFFPLHHPQQLAIRLVIGYFAPNLVLRRS